MSRERVGAAAGVLLLALQLGAVVWARFSPSRYFCWAPFHSASRYTVDATVAGAPLGDLEIATRYALDRLYWDEAARTNWELNTMTHVFDRIRATEARLAETARARVRVTYRENGREPTRWSYP